jgi:HNH endonuclease
MANADFALTRVAGSSLFQSFRVTQLPTYPISKFFLCASLQDPMKKTLQERFEAKITRKPNNGCWLWLGALDPGGYGTMSIARRPKRTHRLAWNLYRGEIPPGMMVCHHCDVRDCVNPDHLFLGTAQDNAEDMKKKGRSRSGERNRAARLTWKQVREMRRLLEQGRLREREVATLCAISIGTVNAIKLGKTWREKQREIGTSGDRDIGTPGKEAGPPMSADQPGKDNLVVE